MNAKRSAFIAMLSALGIALSVISLYVTLGQSAALDLSHIATFVAAIFGGPIVGATVGFFGGLYSGYYFGFVNGGQGFLALIGIPLGKALTGFTAGALYKRFRIGTDSRRSIWTVPITLVAYIPECIFTIFYFLYIVTVVNGAGMAFLLPLIIPKAWMEIAILSIIMGALAGNVGFREFVTRYLHTQKVYKPGTNVDLNKGHRSNS